MHSQVQRNGDPRNGSQTDQLSEAEQSSGAMVVGVQESQGLLLEDQEDGVEEFKVLGEVIEL